MQTSRAAALVTHLRRFAPLQGGAASLDGELLEAFVARRDEAAFEAIVRRHGPMVLGVCRRVLLDFHDAEDAFQATFLVLAKKAHAVKPRHMIGNWLHGVAYRTALEARTVRRKRLSRQTTVSEVPETAALEPKRSEDSLLAALDEELNRLPDHYRIVIVLCDLEGKTQKEVARQLACPAGTVACRLTRGRAMLAKRLRRYGLSVSGGALAIALAGGVASAAVPAPLMVSTLTSAAAVIAGNTTASTASAKVTALMEGALKNMLLTKLRTAVAMILVVACLGVGIGWLALPALWAAQQTVPQHATKQGDQPQERKKNDASSLEGTWAFVSIEAVMNGVRQKRAFDGDTDRNTFSGKKLIQQTKGEGGEFRKTGEFDIILETDKQPPRLTVRATRDRLSIRYIYEIEGDVLRMCFFALGEENGVEVVAWPTEFSLEKDVEKHPTIHILKRVDAPKDLRSVPGRLVEPADARDEAPWKIRATFQGHKDYVLCLAFGIDQLATAGKDDTIKVWDTNTHKELHECKYAAAELGPALQMEFTPDGKHVLMAFEKQIGYWDTSKKIFPRAAIGGVTPLAGMSGQDGHTVVLRSVELNRLALYQVSRFGALGENGDILGFGAASRFVGPFRHTAEIQAAALSPDGAVLAAAAADRTIQLWDAVTKKEQGICKGYSGTLLCLAFAPDGKTLASAGKDGTVRLWGVAKSLPVAVLMGHKGPVRSLAFTPDGSTLASGGDDKTVTLWDVKSATQQSVLRGHTEAVLAVAFSRDGNLLASASKDKTVRLWEPKK